MSARESFGCLEPRLHADKLFVSPVFMFRLLLGDSLSFKQSRTHEAGSTVAGIRFYYPKA